MDEHVWTQDMEAPPSILERSGCPECGAPLSHESGCTICRACGHSACG